MSEQFSIQALNANGIPITNPQDTRSEEGYLKDLTIAGLLTILPGGKITGTISGFTFEITESGVELTSTDSAVRLLQDYIQTQKNTGGIVKDVFIRGEGIEVLDDEIPVFLIDTILDFYRIKKLTVTDTTDSTSKDTGSLITEGGLGVEKSAHIGTNLRVLGTTDATSTTTGSATIAGGLGVDKNIHVGGILVAPTVDIAPVEAADSPYTITNISHIATDSGAGTITVNLPAGTSGRRVVIFDATGSASGNTVTITPNGADTINGAGASITFTTDYQAVTLIFYSGNWTII